MKETALILGGSSGIGLASAKKLAVEGMNLCLLYRARKSEQERVNTELESLREIGVEVLAFNKDILKHEVQVEVVKYLKNKGLKISLLLHSVAKGNLKLMAPIKNSDLLPAALQGAYRDETNYLKEDDFLLTTQAMAVSYYTWAKAILDHDLFAENASCIALTSEGSYKAWRNYAAVSAAKASLEAISRSMALEFAQHGVRSNILQPGVTDTPSLRMIPGSDFLKKQAIQRNPSGRLTKPEDVANVVYLLTRPESQWINGVVLPVDGGESVT